MNWLGIFEVNDDLISGSDMGGGGFMSENSGTPTQGGGGGQKRQRAQNIVPINIKDILDYTEETFQIHGQDVGMIVLVGQVKSVDNQATKSIYQIQDDSGEIEAIHWVDVRLCFFYYCDWPKRLASLLIYFFLKKCSYIFHVKCLANIV